MKTICLYFEIHQIIHLRRYRFFDIGTDHYYYDDYENERSIREIVEHSYMPALDTLLEMINKSGGYFKVALCISGVGIESLELYAPEVIGKIQELAKTGCVEFLAEPYSHGLSALGNEESFKHEVERLSKKIKEYFGYTPKVLRNSSLIYSDDIGLMAADMGFKGMITEGAKHVLGWKSPHYLYHCTLAPKLKLILRDVTLSDDISLRFNDSQWERYPLFAEDYIERIASQPEDEKIYGIFMNLTALGMEQPLHSNILEFFKALPECAKNKGITFSTPLEICNTEKSVDDFSVPYPISWRDEERDISTWLGNTMQREAFNKLYSIADRVRISNDPRINQDWDYLQASDNFSAMSTKPVAISVDRGIYSTPFDAFTNYMNILGDFINRVDALYPAEIDNEELNGLLTTLHNQEKEIELRDKEIILLKAKVEKLDRECEKLRTQLSETKKGAKKPKQKLQLQHAKKP